ncbi:ribosomal small subunit pseudouridine synthase A [Marinobacter sp. JH2]|uniref:pseudouridine synthase n=1 Tax=Marinobacter sp. AL4B TaxID=2871173 RepID=UPI0010551A9E|nr:MULTISPECIES: pseudouridine synthase [unclassified Marinobacter]MBZ0333394.1 pseudouridine synthase [Marinobacter sp. AL4B]QBM16925.1 ribosomal small subunit pseudouridine synthase A [Marinobacter sp. JH2]
MKLSRMVSNQNGVSRKRANALIATGRVSVNGKVCRNTQHDVSEFCAVTADGDVIQQARPSRYIMLNKPAGYLSATVDDIHPTVLKLIDPALHEDLHIGGRLDRASTGLLILTNDGNWSRRLTEPEIKIPKVYRVTTENPITADTHQRFSDGIWFEYEQLTTSPAQIEVLDEREARITIYEGRYHQVKRMFHAVGNRVTSLHRERMGRIQLDDELTAGEHRPLTAEEIASV